MIPKKKPRRLTRYTRELLDIVDQYVSATGDVEPEMIDVARYALNEGLIDKPFVDLLKIVARALARACRQDYIVDEGGEPVRRRHAFREKRGDRQLTFWAKIEEITPEKMRLSLQSRKVSVVQDVMQIERDRRYYNGHHNPGDPIEMDHNINLDVEEYFMPADYPDSPPDDELAD